MEKKKVEEKKQQPLWKIVLALPREFLVWAREIKGMLSEAISEGLATGSGQPPW